MLNKLILNEATNDELASAFVEAVSVHVLSPDDDSGTDLANDAALRIKHVCEELLARDNGLEAIARLLSHDNPFVQIWALPYGLKHLKVDGESILAKLQEHSVKRVRFEARQIAFAWQRGIL